MYIHSLFLVRPFTVLTRFSRKKQNLKGKDPLPYWQQGEMCYEDMQSVEWCCKNAN
jgi:hypothetical protein